MKFNFKEIIEGWRNLVIPPVELREVIEEIANERQAICNVCPFQSENARAKGEYKSFRMDLHCTKCGCPLAAKTRSLSSACPLGFWTALTDDETRYQIEQKAYNENTQPQEGDTSSTEESSGDISESTTINPS